MKVSIGENKEAQEAKLKVLVGISKKDAIQINKEIALLQGKARSLNAELRQLLVIDQAYRAAKNALANGVDYSNGGFFWDGKDIKTNYEKHFKVKHGIKITEAAHNIYNIKNSTKIVIITKVKIFTDKKGKKTSVSEEIGRYDHVYESTSAQGGTIFWKHNQEYMALTKAKEYK